MARFLLPVLVFSTLTVVVTSTTATAVAPIMTVSIGGGGEVIAGDTTTFGITASNTGATDGFNLALILDVPEGIEFDSSTLGDPVIYDALNPPPTPLPAGIVRWVWEDVSDLPAGGNYGVSVTVHPTQPFPPDATGTVETSSVDVFPVGSTFDVNAYAALSGDPTYLPVFNGSTGVGGPIAESETTEEGPSTATTDMIALDLTKSEPHPESELPRGVHDQTTIYTLTIRNTTEGPTDNVILVDHIPAGLEFLGCGLTDNSTVDRGLGDVLVNEYDGAPGLTGTPLIPTNCPTPVSVDTVVADATLAATYGVTVDATYTQVTWNLGTLASGETRLVRYAAAVPLYENTVTWDGMGGAPSAASLDQTANLDNNNGPSTRHGDIATPVDGDTWTNVANVIGDYQGIVRTGADRATPDRTTETIYAMDLAVQKSVTGGDPFVVGQVTDFTLHLVQSEYMNSEDIVLTDTLPNGLCPLMPTGTTLTEHDGITVPAECLVVGTVTGADMISVDAYGDGTFVIVFRPTSATYPDPDDFILGPNETHDITFDALNRDAYELAPSVYGPTTSGDGFGNTVEFDATDFAIPDLLAWFPDPWFVWDDSGAGIGSDLTTISKRVMPRDEVLQEPYAPGDTPCTGGTFGVGPETGFRLGDTACFQLTVNFPSSIDVRNPVVTDFLPQGLTYAGHEINATLSTVPPGEIQEDATHATDGRLEWKLGHPNPGDPNPDLYVTRGQVLVVDLWATVDAPSSGPILDKPENLMKYRQQNVEGELYFLRDQAEIEIDPELELIKGVLDVNGASTPPALTEDDPDGANFASNRDGILVREGDVVTYRVDLRGMPYPAEDATVWDVLPPGMIALDVSAISAGGIAYDPGDPGYPAGMDPTLNTRSVVVWTGVDVPYVPAELESRKTLTYDLTIPVGTSVATTHDNDASIISYSASINTSGALDAQVYYPTDSYDVSLTSLWNTPGTFTRDDSNVYLPSVSVAKSLTTEFNVVNNGIDQAVKGEIVHSTYSATVPAHTTVQHGIFSDTLPSPTYWTILSGLTTVTYPATVPPFDPTGFSLDTSTGTLTFPATYANTTDADQVFTVDLYAYVNPLGTDPWGHDTDTARTDTATFASDTQGDETWTADLYVIAPNPLIQKLADPDSVTAGQSVTYELRVRNDNDDVRPTLFDSFVVDCVPPQLTGVVLGVPTQGSAAFVPDVSCAGTRIVWDVGVLLSGSVNQEFLTYTATVDPLSAGLATYTNPATITGYSLDDPLSDRATSTQSTTESVTVLGAPLVKDVDFPTATIGQERTYTLSTTLPANVNFYDAAIIDDVPAGLAVSNVTLTCTYGLGGSCIGNAPALPGDLPSDAGDPLNPSGTNIGWWLGDISSNVDTRTITITYTGTVLDVSANFDTETIVNTGILRWNTTNDIVGPPADASYTPDVASPPDDATITVVEPDVEIAKLVNGLDADTVAPGETFTYSVTATNVGTSTAFDVTVSDVVPDGVIVNGASVTASGGVLSGADPTTGGGTISWLLSSLATGAGDSHTFTYTAVLEPSSYISATDSFVNVATVTGFTSHPTSTLGYDDDELRTYAGPAADAEVTPDFPDPTVTKTPAAGPAYVGLPHSFTIVVTNTGTSLAQNGEVVDTLPADWSYTTGSTTIDGIPASDPSISGQDLTWSSLPTLDPTEHFTIVYTASPDAAATWTVANTGAAYHHTNDVTVTVEDSTGSSGNDDGDYTDDTDAWVAIDRADVVIDKVHVGSPTAGATFSWTITVTNAGPDLAAGPFVVVDTLPADATYTGFAGMGWSDDTSVPGQVTFTHAGSLANGDALPVITVNVTLPADLANDTDFDNSATVSDDTLDLDLTNNTDTDPAQTVIVADVQLVKTSIGGSFTAGDTITWHIDVTNNGPSVASAPFTMTDTLPATLDWGSVTANGIGWSCNLVTGSGALVCTSSTMILGVWDSLPTLTVEAAILSDVTDNIDNTATVVHPTPDTVPGNNTDTTSDPVGTSADLSLVKTTTSLDIPASGTGTFRVELANAGPSDALAVTVEDHLPVGLTYLGLVDMAPSDTWTCGVNIADPSQVDCSLDSNSGTLPNGGATWFEFEVQADGTWSNSDLNTATVTSTTPDPDFTNNTDDSTTAPELIVNKGAVPTTVERGSTVVYTINVQSMSYGSTDDVTLTDPIPAQLHVDSIVIDASADPTVPDWLSCDHTGADVDGYGGTLTCDLNGTLARGRTTPDIVLTTTVRPSTTPGPLLNVATVEWVDTTGAAAATFSAVDDATIGVTLTRAELAATGSDGLMWRIALALALMALGGWFIMASRRVRRV